MTQEQKGLEMGKDYRFSNAGTVAYQRKDSRGLSVFVPLKGQFSGEAIRLTKHQIRLLIRENLPVEPQQG